jgi:hypothetical protein
MNHLWPDRFHGIHYTQFCVTSGREFSIASTGSTPYTAG